MTAAEAVKREIHPVPASYPIRRVHLPDLSDKGSWLTKRLQDHLAHLQPSQIFGWLRGVIDSQEYLFLRTANAVALAQIVHEKLDPAPTVRERFVFCTDEESRPEALALYGEIRRWAKDVGASEILVGVCTDVPKEEIKKELGRVFVRESLFART